MLVFRGGGLSVTVEILYSNVGGVLKCLIKIRNKEE